MEAVDHPAAAALLQHHVDRGIAVPVCRGAGEAGIRPASSSKTGLTPKDVIESVRAEVIPLDKNYYRNGIGLEASRDRVEAVWRDVRDHLSAEGLDRVRSREAASIVASGRWSLTAALARQESRGMHRRTDFKSTDNVFTRNIILTGVDSIRARGETESRKDLAS